jgi:hypothetical protein
MARCCRVCHAMSQFFVYLFTNDFLFLAINRYLGSIAGRMNHIPRERLSTVAKDDLRFTDVEFDHVHVCIKCFEVWIEPIRHKGPHVVWNAFERHIANRRDRRQGAA